MENLQIRKLRGYLTCGFAIVFLLPATGGSPALAQSDTSSQIEEIVVTGSRLRRDDLSAPSPTVIVSEEAVRLSGRGTLEGLLNELPQLNADFTSSTANISGAGLHTANLRSLGAVRTLVLVNGKRFTPANESGLTDLSRIPDALIERIEVITGGASAVYGSDAIAGAVNFIMRDDFEGLDVRYNYGSSMKDDAQNNKVDLIFGAKSDNDRGRIVANLSWYDQEPALFDDRAYSAINVDVRNGKLVPAGSSNIPGTRVNLSTTQIASLVGVDMTNFTSDRDFSAGGAGGCTRISGVRFGRNGVPLPYCDPENRFNYNPTNYLLRPLERYNLNVLASWNITDRIEAYTEMFSVNQSNTWNLNAASFSPNTSGQQGLVLPRYATNPVLFQATKDFITANAAIFDPDGDGNALISQAGRRLNESGSRYFSYDINSYSYTGGLRGNIDFGSSDWNWDTYYQIQRATEAQHFTGGLSSLRLSLGADVTVDAATNEARCTNVFVGCVPVNFLGLDAVTPEMVGFLTPDKGDQESFDRRVFHASMNGDLFEMPAGTASAAFGFEFREQSYQFRPGGLNESGLNGAALAAVDVRNDVSEFFTELRIPVLEKLAVELAYRRSDYSSSGDNNTYKFAVEYAAQDWFRVRGAVNRAVRAPNLNELFGPQKVSFEGGDDPCNSLLNPSSAVKDLCVKTGIPASDIDTYVPGIELSGRRGGNPNLDVEESDTVTVGFVVSPPQFEGLNLTVDFFNIEVNSAITETTAEQVINTCYAQTDPNSPYCKAVIRFAAGQVQEVLAVASNFASLQVSGFDLAFDWSFPLPDSWRLGNNSVIGTDASFSISGLVSILNERITHQIPSQPAIDCAGFVGLNCSGFSARMVPNFGSKIDFRYYSGDFSIGATVRKIGEFEFSPGDTRAAVFNNEVPAEIYWDFDARYEINDSIQVFGLVKNAFDNEPQLMGQQIQGDSGVDVGLYDVIGARYTVGVRYLFDQ
jgi:iron complex outermembrane receptor protein